MEFSGVLDKSSRLSPSNTHIHTLTLTMRLNLVRQWTACYSDSITSSSHGALECDQKSNYIIQRALTFPLWDGEGGQLWAFLKAVEWNQCDQYVRFPWHSSDGLESLLHTTALFFLTDKCKSMCVCKTASSRPTQTAPLISEHMTNDIDQIQSVLSIRFQRFKELRVSSHHFCWNCFCLNSIRNV